MWYDSTWPGFTIGFTYRFGCWGGVLWKRPSSSACRSSMGHQNCWCHMVEFHLALGVPMYYSRLFRGSLVKKASSSAGGPLMGHARPRAGRCYHIQCFDHHHIVIPPTIDNMPKNVFQIRCSAEECNKKNPHAGLHLGKGWWQKCKTDIWKYYCSTSHLENFFCGRYPLIQI